MVGATKLWRETGGRQTHMPGPNGADPLEKRLTKTHIEFIINNIRFSQKMREHMIISTRRNGNWEEGEDRACPALREG